MKIVVVHYPQDIEKLWNEIKPYLNLKEMRPDFISGTPEEIKKFMELEHKKPFVDVKPVEIETIQRMEVDESAAPAEN